MEDFFLKRKALTFKKGEIIIQPEEVPAGVFLIEKGHVRVYSETEWGEEKLFIIYKAGDIFPIFWAIDNLPIRRFYEALDDVTIRCATKREFLDFLNCTPAALFQVTKRIVAVLNAYVDRVDSLEYTNSYARMVSFLLNIAQRFGEKRGTKIIITTPFTHKDIAASLALSRETASRELEELEKKHIIRYVNHFIVIEDMEKLQTELSAHYNNKLL